MPRHVECRHSAAASRTQPLFELARAESSRNERDLLRRDAEPVERIAGHLDGELFLSEDDLVRARLAQVVRRVARVRPRNNAEALVRTPRVFHNATRRLRVAKRDNEEDRAIEVRPLE